MYWFTKFIFVLHTYATHLYNDVHVFTFVISFSYSRFLVTSSKVLIQEACRYHTDLCQSYLDHIVSWAERLEPSYNEDDTNFYSWRYVNIYACFPKSILMIFMFLINLKLKWLYPTKSVCDLPVIVNWVLYCFFLFFLRMTSGKLVLDNHYLQADSHSINFI